MKKTKNEIQTNNNCFKEGNLRKTFVYYIVLLVGYNLHHFIILSDKINFQNTKDSTTCYFCVIQVSYRNITRILTSYKAWGQYAKSVFGDEYEIYSPIDIPVIGNKVHYAKRNYYKIFSFALGYLYLDASRDFLKNSTSRWFMRTTDDAFIDLPKFHKYINFLEKHYDPLKDFVVKGEKIEMIKDVYYIHGGSGWLMSRYAVEKVLDKIIKMSMPKQTSGDDVVIPKYFLGFNYSEQQWDSPVFQGFPANNETLRRITENDYKNLTVCKKEPKRRLIDIAVWHAGNAEMTNVVKGAEILTSAPSNVFIEEAIKGNFGFCRDWPNITAMTWNSTVYL